MVGGGGWWWVVVGVGGGGVCGRVVITKVKLNILKNKKQAENQLFT